MSNFYKTPKWKNKRANILKRDGYRCQECKRYGKTTEATTVHHINPLREKPELKLINWNLISLCGNCHDKMHDRNSDILTALGELWRERVSPLP
ncbi:HNH endonuclease [Peribacillus alkalitolerans]|uniref:HNH endonuclease n=1 Tax=Peribacillus alkalitolerans TaxID=1550385 RepID=UPI0013D670BB|nr:HNH endonuclease [Peribacillus alkalitolerans]